MKSGSVENAFHFDSSLKHKLMQAARQGKGGGAGRQGYRPLIDDLQRVIEARRIVLSGAMRRIRDMEASNASLSLSLSFLLPLSLSFVHS